MTVSDFAVSTTVARKGHFRASDDVRISYSIHGDEGAKPLLLVHSLGMAMESWMWMLPSLSAQYRLICPDLRGHGGSDVPPKECTIERLAIDLIELLDELNISRVGLVGVSLGGMIGQWLGVNSAERVEHLVLANTSAYMGPPSAWTARMAEVEALGMTAVADAVIDRWFTEDFRTSSPQDVSRCKQMLLASEPLGYVRCCAAIRDMDQRQSLGKIRVPTLVVAGRYDRATPLEHAQLLQARIPSARLEIVDSAHLANVEAPKAFNRLITQFLVPLP